MICGLNYFPFIDKYHTINGIVEKLKVIANQTNNLEYIHGKGENANEIKKSKEAKFRSVKYFYLPPKGIALAKTVKNNKGELNAILSTFASEPNDAAVAVVADSIDVSYAVRDHQSGSGSSVKVSPPKKLKLSDGNEIVAEPIDVSYAVRDRVLVLRSRPARQKRHKNSMIRV